MSQKQDELGKAALSVLLATCGEFPGLLDGETEVNGADLTEWLTVVIDKKPALKVALERLLTLV